MSSFRGSLVRPGCKPPCMSRTVINQGESCSVERSDPTTFEEIPQKVEAE